jgi:DNA-binding response OmpR family regulator
MDASEPARTVLIIEPDALTAQLYHRELGRRFRVITCPTASAGAAVIADEALSAVVLEPAGAEATLEAVVAALKSDIHEHALPLIICSVLDDRQVSRTLGAVVHLVKPVLPATLLAAISAINSRRFAAGEAFIE